MSSFIAFNLIRIRTMKRKIICLLICWLILPGCSDHKKEDNQSSLDAATNAVNATHDQNSAQTVKGELIPRSLSDNANYYLLSAKQEGNYIETLHTRVSASSHGYSVTRIDCQNNRFQDLGYGEAGEDSIRMYDNPTWAEVFPGSSKSDLVSFVCNKS